MTSREIMALKRRAEEDNRRNEEIRHRLESRRVRQYFTVPIIAALAVECTKHIIWMIQMMP